jgi:tRNA threonylcarbamoyladenosine biosynthesis protein TsaB
MIILLDTSTSICRLTLIEGDNRSDETWQADRNLASGLLQYLNEQLQTRGKSWTDIEAIGVFEGPGSFTGLRIGLTVMNTIADARAIPIVGSQGSCWQQDAVARIKRGENSQIVLPRYGSEVHITKPRK